MSFYYAFQVFKEKAREAVFPSLTLKPLEPALAARTCLHSSRLPTFLSSSPGAQRITAKHRGSKTIHLFKICWTLPASQVPGGALVDTAPTAYCRDRYEIDKCQVIPGLALTGCMNIVWCWDLPTSSSWAWDHDHTHLWGALHGLNERN